MTSLVKSVVVAAVALTAVASGAASALAQEKPTVQGCVYKGVEAGCWVLVPFGGKGHFSLHAPEPLQDSKAYEVWGKVGGVDTCMQGKVLTATKVVQLRTDCSLKVYTGTLKTGVMVQGGETTGITITTKDGVYELDLVGDEALGKLAESLNGARVTVEGTLYTKAGVEVPLRRIIRVKSITKG